MKNQILIKFPTTNFKHKKFAISFKVLSVKFAPTLTLFIKTCSRKLICQKTFPTLAFTILTLISPPLNKTMQELVGISKKKQKSKQKAKKYFSVPSQNLIC